LTSTEPPTIQLLKPADADDLAVVSRLTGLINEVYRAAEDGLWIDTPDRTSVDEVAGLVRAGEIAVARLDGEIIGTVRVQSLDAGTGEFGMLSAGPAFRGVGLGRELVQYAEQWAREQGHTRMQLELLVPREWVHPSKDFLARWYSRLGYVITGKGSIEESYAHLAPHLATPCDFFIYHKELTV
jgi:GNAT superfamily N-acetyltransferase